MPEAVRDKEFEELLKDVDLRLQYYNGIAKSPRRPDGTRHIILKKDGKVIREVIVKAPDLRFPK
jgi:hypothetical protein